MPELSGVQLIQLIVLILVVPVQYFLTRQTSENQRQYVINTVLSELSEFRKSYLSFQSWFHWCSQLLTSFTENTEETTPPSEIRKNNLENEGHFGSSEEPRVPHPPHVKFRVGQVVKHKKYGYRGVIVGWDEVAKAPEKWIKEMHPADKPHWRKMPNYAVLVDTRDRWAPQVGYVVEEHLEVITSTKIFHPLVEHYFENFDGAQYLPRPWLRKIYPYD